jgi:hypothetical protein
MFKLLLYIEISSKNRFVISEADRIVLQNKAGLEI